MFAAPGIKLEPLSHSCLVASIEAASTAVGELRGHLGTLAGASLFVLKVLGHLSTCEAAAPDPFQAHS